MKQSLITFFLVINIFLNLKSQPILTAANSNPVIGDVFQINYFKPTDNFDSTGINYTWDLSSMITYYGYTTQQTASSIGTTFPSSSIQICDTDHNCLYYSYSNSYFELAGEDYPPSPSGPFWKYVNPIRYLNYPFQMGDNFTDSFLCEVYSWTGGLNGWDSGYIRNTADGYGTIILPNGTFNNVLRVKSIYYVIGKSTTGSLTDSTIRVIYQWYKPNIHQPIGYVIRDSITSGQIDTIAYYLNFNPTSVFDYGKDETKFSISPNPAKDNFVVQFEIAHENLNFNLTDIVGRQIPIKVVKYSSTKYLVCADVKGVSVCFLNIIQNGKQISTEKIQLSEW